MTFRPDEMKLWHREYPMFCLWASRGDFLFIPKEVSEDKEEVYDLTAKAYILMKRLGQNYNDIMRMSSSERDTLFQMEMELIKKEAEEKKKT